MRRKEGEGREGKEEGRGEGGEEVEKREERKRLSRRRVSSRRRRMKHVTERILSTDWFSFLCKCVTQVSNVSEIRCKWCIMKRIEPFP